MMFSDTAQIYELQFDKLLLFEDVFFPWQKAAHPVYGEFEKAGYEHVDLKWILKDGNKFTVRVKSVKGGRASDQSE
jgi:hypothetical protein